MTKLVGLEGKLGRLSVQNKELIVFMANEMVKHAEKVGSENFKRYGYMNGEKAIMIREVSEKTKVNKPTVSRIFYSYNNKMSFEELVEIAKEYQESIIVEETSVDKNKTILFVNQIINLNEIDGKCYVELDELFKKLPISEKNKVMRNAFSVKCRKTIIKDGITLQYIELEKVKQILQSYISRLQEGQIKNDLRTFIHSIHQVMNPTISLTNKPSKPVVIPMNINKTTEVEKEVLVKKALPTNNVKLISDSSNEIKQESLNNNIISTTDTVRGKMNQPVAKEKIINEDKELTTLVKMLNGVIGYLTPEAKGKLMKMVQENGLVNTVLATSEMLNDIEKDTSLYFVNKIEQKTKECL